MLQLLVFYLAREIREVNYHGHEIHRLTFYGKNINWESVRFDLSQSLAVYERIARSNQSNDSELIEVKLENIPLNGDFSNLLRTIHENFFWNHHLYDRCYRYYQYTGYLILFALAIISLFLIPLLDKDPIDKVLRLMFGLITFNLVFETFDSAKVFLNASKAMLELDNEACRAGTNIDGIWVMHLFTKYHYWKSVCGSIPDSIYKKIKMH